MRTDLRPQPTPVYRREQPALWWTAKRWYVLYMVREASAILVGLFVLFYLYGIVQLASGPAEYAEFLRLLRSPGAILFNVVALGFTLYHTWTWISLTPRIQKMQLGGREAPPQAVVAGSIVIWLLLSAVIAWILL